MQPGYDTEEKRWKAVQARDASADTRFIYGVITTGVYCYPSCPSRTALRENMRYYESREAAVADGLRPCKRCLSDGPPLVERQRRLVEQACRMIAAATEVVKVDTLASELAVSRFHLQKMFRQFLGVSPKQYIKSVRSQNVHRSLESQSTVTDALLAAGYDSSSAYYADGAQRIGMSAKTYRKRGEGLEIRYAFGSTRFGRIIVAATEQGVCSVLFGDNSEALLADLRERFSRASLHEDSQYMQMLVDEVSAGIENPALADGLPLDIQGTAFQEKVWAALRRIEPGTTASYAQIAASIGKPTAARAVASACASNPIAVLVPCHRVVGARGDLSGYRWGRERKQQLLDHECNDETD